MEIKEAAGHICSDRKPFQVTALLQEGRESLISEDENRKLRPGATEGELRGAGRRSAGTLGRPRQGSSVMQPARSKDYAKPGGLCSSSCITRAFC